MQSSPAGAEVREPGVAVPARAPLRPLSALSQGASEAGLHERGIVGHGLSSSFRSGAAYTRGACPRSPRMTRVTPSAERIEQLGASNSVLTAGSPGRSPGPAPLRACGRVRTRPKRPRTVCLARSPRPEPRAGALAKLGRDRSRASGAGSGQRFWPAVLAGRSGIALTVRRLGKGPPNGSRHASIPATEAVALRMRDGALPQRVRARRSKAVPSAHGRSGTSADGREGVTGRPARPARRVTRPRPRVGRGWRRRGWSRA